MRAGVDRPAFLNFRNTGATMNVFRGILLVLAFVLFLLAGFGVGHPRFNLMCGGLAAWVLAEIIPMASHFPS
jgi:hypothetical protein